MSVLSRFSAAVLLLAGLLLTAQLRAEDAAPAATALESAPAPMETAAPAPEQPPAAFKAEAPRKTVKKKSSSQDFVKKHTKKKKKPTKRKAAITPPPQPKTFYDPASAEPSEELMAVKRRAEREFWNGRQPLPNAASTRSGIASTALTAPTPNGMERAGSSDLAGVTFDDQPLRMPETEPFRRSIDTVAFELGRPCHGREYLGWPLQQSEQGRVDGVFNDTLEKLRQRGFTIAPHQPKAAGRDVSVFTADRVDGMNSRYILGLWSAGDVGLLLLMCETSTPADLIAAEAKSKEALEKSKKKKPRPRKKSKTKSTASAAAAVKAEEKPAEAPPPAAAASQAYTDAPAAPAAVATPVPPSIAAAPAPAPVPAAPVAPAADDGKPKVMPGVAPGAAAPASDAAPSSAPASTNTPGSSSSDLPPPPSAAGAPEPESNAAPSSNVQTMSYDDPPPKPAEEAKPVVTPGKAAAAPAKPTTRNSALAPPPADAAPADTTNTTTTPAQ